MSKSWTRRRVLSSLGLVTAAGGAGLTLRYFTHERDYQDWVVQVHEILPHVKDVSALGRLYLEQVPEESNPELLIPLIFADESGRLRGDPKSGLERSMRYDYSTGNIFRVDGWVLSRTECRFSGLVALMLERGDLKWPR